MVLINGSISASESLVLWVFWKWRFTWYYFLYTFKCIWIFSNPFMPSLRDFYKYVFHCLRLIFPFYCYSWFQTVKHKAQVSASSNQSRTQLPSTKEIQRLDNLDRHCDWDCEVIAIWNIIEIDMNTDWPTRDKPVSGAGGGSGSGREMSATSRAVTYFSVIF